MGRIQANTGIITGIPITETVNQLLAIQARPRDLLISRAKDLQAQQVAVTELTASVIGLQLAARKLGQATTFQQKNVVSSQPNLLTAKSTGTPSDRSYQFTPVRQATAQQLLSTGFASKTDPVGAGSFTLQYGGFVNEGIELSQLNGGAGISRGKIRITDRSGESAVVDLRFVQTVDDVLQAINTTDSIAVSAVAVGDKIKLIDRSGGTLSNLKVQEVSGGSTAADLGLAGIDVAANSATGSDILKLYAGLSLEQLNDGNGLSIHKELADLNVTFRDGTSLKLDFHRKASAAAPATATTTGDPEAQITFTVVASGGDFDGVRIVYVDDPGITQGNETVVFNDSDPDVKTLTFHIDAGATTGDDIRDALNNDPVASELLTAARATGSDGTGLVTVNDTAVTSGGAALTPKTERTLGELLATINAADPNRLKAEISADGDRIQLTDLTANYGGTFAVTDVSGGSLAADLGLTGAAVGGTLTGQRIQSGLKTTLLHSLGGGDGLGTLGAITITDRSGTSANVNLAAAETLDDVLTAVNSSALGIEARINNARSGLEIVDTTGAVASNFKIVSADASNTAQKLNIAIDAATTSVDSGTLNRQNISENTLLSSLNGGKGVARTSFFVSDSNNVTTVIRLDNDDIQTVGDLLDAINGLTIGVEARLNAEGNGIEVVDTAGGPGLPSIRDVGSGTAAKDLHLTGGAEEVEIEGEPQKVIRGRQTYAISVEADESLTDVVKKINDLNAGFTASIFSDGSGQTPFRLSINSQTVGREASLQVSSSYDNVQFEELVAGQNALLQLGAGGNSAGVLINSATNTFEDVVPGLSVTVVAPSNSAVSVNVSQSSVSVVSTVQLFVDQYNKLRDKLESLTFFNETDQKTGVLFGSLEALRVDTEISSLMSGRFIGTGDIRALKEIGIDLTDDGHITFDATILQDKFDSDPEAVQEFFTKDKVGFADKMDDLIEDLSGAKNSLLVNKAQSLGARIELYNERVATWNARLTLSRDAMLKKFYNLETLIGKLQNDLSTVSGIQTLPSLIAQP